MRVCNQSMVNDQHTQLKKVNFTTKENDASDAVVIAKPVGHALSANL